MLLHQVSGRSRLGLALSLLTVLLWGFLAIALKIVLQELDPFTVTWFRFTIAGIVLGFYLALRQQLPTWQQLQKIPLPIFLTAVVGLSANYILFLTGLGKTSANNAQVLAQLSPVIMGLASLIIFKEKYTYKQWVGVAVLIFGLVLFSHEQIRSLVSALDSYMWGNVLLVFGSIVWAFYGLAQKQLLLNLPSTSVMLCLYLSAATLFVPMAHPIKLLSLSGSHMAILIFCAFNTLIAYGAFASALEHWEASRVSAILTLTPLVTLGASALLPVFAPHLLPPSSLSLLSWFGAIAVVCGSLMTSLSSKLRS
ncbi:MAG: EamA family transporter [Pseudanabaena frigida]|uniref:EamA family transporter n=1 Tax=Pseudanabaena frigida TaxID=945775 RepID=A0A2W4XZC2_9CYAN|nr:MAG: EamA family transporter [Pseudanabaena frigida]